MHTGRAKVILFPLCDRRGRLSRILSDASAAELYAETRPETIFFSWLLELPPEIRPADAATALLNLHGQGPGTNAAWRLIRHLQRLLQDVASQ